MKTIFLLFDSLNRKALGPYDSSVPTPNFDRLAQKSITFTNHYAGSMPCMPARRDQQTGRYNFFHSAWGPMEPYDNSLPRLLRERKGVYSHITTDHAHYFEDGGAFYCTNFNTWEFHRGQEYDPWIPEINPDMEILRKRYDSRHYDFSHSSRSEHKLQFAKNKNHRMKKSSEFPMVRCFDSAMEFLDINKNAENWFLQLETFDPHEPFDIPEEYLDRYNIDKTTVMNWPNYARPVESPEEIDRIRRTYAALVAFCDDQLGRLLDRMDADNMWDDTSLIVSTDHGFLLSEHDWWSKVIMPNYQEISHIPLFIHHPKYKMNAGTQRNTVTSVIDLMPTVLDWYDCDIPEEVKGHSLTALLEEDRDEERVVSCGVFGGTVLITDGRYAYHLCPQHLDSTNLYEYRIHPCHMRGQFSIKEMQDSELYNGFNFTKGMPLLKIKGRDDSQRVPNHDAQGFQDTKTRLFDLFTDPTEENPVSNPQVEARLKSRFRQIMEDHDAPQEMFDRYGV
ncbi:MAG: sulfatase [Spirochaetales bacterium]|nr:sulfatase [Spirochaetales bacterium]